MSSSGENTKDSRKPESKTPAFTVIREFCDYTSIHGLGRTVGAKYLVQRIIWLLFFLGALATSAYNLSELYAKYESRPIGTSTFIQRTSSLHFPTVTICNLNPIRKTSLKQFPSKDYTKLQNLLEKAQPVFEPISKDAPALPTLHLSLNSTPVPEISDAVNQSLATSGSSLPIIPLLPTSLPSGQSILSPDGSSLPNLDDLITSLPASLPSRQSNPSPELGNKMKPIIGNKIIDSSAVEHRIQAFELEEAWSTILASIDENKLVAAGHQFNDTVVNCWFRGLDCKQSSIARWSTFWHYKYGNCFVFNPGGKMKTLKSNVAGSVHGLSLRLFVDQKNYIDQLSTAAGFKVLVSPQGIMPFPYEDGITVTTGVSTSLGIRKVEKKRDNSRQQTRCLDTKTNSPENLFKVEYGVSYSLMACMESCLASNQQKHCECTEYRYPRHVTSSVCDNLNSSVAKCLANVERMNENNDLNCSKECLPPCREESFKITTSLAAWPSKNYEARATLEAKLDSNDTKMIPFRDNYLEVRVYYKDLNNEVTEERSSYGPIDFISDIGGQLGLWLGVSVLTAMEVIEVIVLLIVYSRGRKTKIRDGENTFGLKETSSV